MLTEAQLESIIRYVDDKLSVEEEMLFIRQLNANEELQKAFDLELVTRALRAEQEVNDKDDADFEPDGKFSATAKKSETPATSFLTKIKMASVTAAVILIVVVSVLYCSRLPANKKVIGNNGRQQPDKSVNDLKGTTQQANSKK